MTNDSVASKANQIAGSVGPANAGSLIESRKLNFAYSSLPAVVDVALSLPRGAMGALIGANGSGKSTLIRLLAGLLKPDSGQVLFNGAPLESLQARERAKRIAYVPQAAATVFPFTALEVVLTGRSPYSGRFRFESAHDEQIALAALDALDAGTPRRAAHYGVVRWRAPTRHGRACAGTGAGVDAAG